MCMSNMFLKPRSLREKSPSVSSYSTSDTVDSPLRYVWSKQTAWERGEVAERERERERWIRVRERLREM